MELWGKGVRKLLLISLCLIPYSLFPISAIADDEVIVKKDTVYDRKTESGMGFRIITPYSYEEGKTAHVFIGLHNDEQTVNEFFNLMRSAGWWDPFKDAIMVFPKPAGSFWGEKQEEDGKGVLEIIGMVEPSIADGAVVVMGSLSSTKNLPWAFENFDRIDGLILLLPKKMEEVPKVKNAVDTPIAVFIPKMEDVPDEEKELAKEIQQAYYDLEDAGYKSVKKFVNYSETWQDGVKWVLKEAGDRASMSAGLSAALEVLESGDYAAAYGTLKTLKEKAWGKYYDRIVAAIKEIEEYAANRGEMFAKFRVKDKSGVWTDDFLRFKEIFGGFEHIDEVTEVLEKMEKTKRKHDKDGKKRWERFERQLAEGAIKPAYSSLRFIINSCYLSDLRFEALKKLDELAADKEKFAEIAEDFKADEFDRGIHFVDYYIAVDKKELAKEMLLKLHKTYCEEKEFAGKLKKKFKDLGIDYPEEGDEGETPE